MIYKKITVEDVLAARSYVPLAEKTAFVEKAARQCFEKLEIHAKDAGRDLPVPPMYKESLPLKSRYMMGALVKLYLGKQIEPVEGTEFLLAQDDYDRWAGGHIFGQLEQMKQTAQVRTKVFDLMQDYKSLEKQLNMEIYGLCNVMNDPCHRVMLMLQMQVTPERMQKMAEELKQVQTALEQYKDERKPETESAGG